MTDDHREIRAVKFVDENPALSMMVTRVTGYAGPSRLAVVATLADGEEKQLFGWYTDELTFSESEFVGLTVAEAYRLFHDKDMAYLQR